MNQLLKATVAASWLLLGGCAVMPQAGHLRPVTKARANPLEFVCVKTDEWKPCTPVRRDDLRMMRGWRMVLGTDDLP